MSYEHNFSAVNRILQIKCEFNWAIKRIVYCLGYNKSVQILHNLLSAKYLINKPLKTFKRFLVVCNLINYNLNIISSHKKYTIKYEHIQKIACCSKYHNLVIFFFFFFL